MASPILFKRLFAKARIISHSLDYFQPTVYALSTPPGTSAISVIRISGSACLDIYKALTTKSTEPPQRRASLRKLYNPKNPKIMLDHALILFFPGPKSYTGENLLELHLHGGKAVVKSVLEAISELHSTNKPIRLAEPGEFSKRGFQNGRFDLTEVEGINTLIHAETETQRISALKSMEGETKVQFFEWRKEILNNVALLATVIDFGEDHDIEEINELFDRVATNIKALDLEIKDYLEKINRSQILLDGIKVTLTGPPNAGKSSLLNILAGNEKAIVSGIAGTTRDSIEVPLDINGYKVVIGDTAGIRDSDDFIEQEGIKRAKKISDESNINLLLLPANDLFIDQLFLEHAKKIIVNDLKDYLIIVNKSDLIKMDERQKLIERMKKLFGVSDLNLIFISCANEEGIVKLIKQLCLKFKKLSLSETENPIALSQRAKEIIVSDILSGFEEFYIAKDMDDVFLASESLKLSIDGIGKITGESLGVEEILGVVFSSFCIGK